MMRPHNKAVSINIFTLIAFFMQISNSFTESGFETVKEMFDACSGVPHLSAGRTLDSSVILGAIKCQSSMDGYILGASLTTELYKHLYIMLASVQDDKIKEWERHASNNVRKLAGVCLPPETSPHKVALLFISYVSKNPKRDNNGPWIGALHEALIEKFPCEEGLPPSSTGR